MPQPRNPDHPTRRPAELRQGTCKIAAETKGGSLGRCPVWRVADPYRPPQPAWGSNTQNANCYAKTPQRPLFPPFPGFAHWLPLGYRLYSICLGRADSKVRRGNVRGYTRSPQTDRGARR